MGNGVPANRKAFYTHKGTSITQGPPLLGGLILLCVSNAPGPLPAAVVRRGTNLLLCSARKPPSWWPICNTLYKS